ncbi:hypothetical protein [Roseitranquillus sediminis]|uniref:hypothetical protein n=1 Tax=Roseitranquillus sediminis TaxID=2809051 RepID=UPI001D0CA68E|nr:hypothetical protein [Roseitranquillus sediminis]MBM9594555.1 hypothetical protein [Roseitranquillus sediminis]
MRADFALDLGLDRVRLLAQTDFGDESLGEVRLDDPSFRARLAELRRTAGRDGPLPVDALIPRSQILYLDIAGAGEGVEHALATRLEGATSYDVRDLIWDVRLDGGTSRVAVVARETLAEAQSFLDQHGFVRQSFAARPAPEEFPGVPHFKLAPREAPAFRSLRPAAAHPQPEPPAVTPLPQVPQRPRGEIARGSKLERSAGRRRLPLAAALAAVAVAAGVFAWSGRPAATPAPADTAHQAEAPAAPAIAEVPSAEPKRTVVAAAPEPAATPPSAQPSAVSEDEIVWVAPDFDFADEIYLPDFDGRSGAHDAIALAEPLVMADVAPQPVLLPPTFGTTYTFDDRGLVVATPDGVLTPDGALIYAGAPPLVPPMRPGPEAATRKEPEPEVAEVTTPVEALPGTRPRLRPAEMAVAVVVPAEPMARPRVRPDLSAVVAANVAAGTDFAALAQQAREQASQAAASTAPAAVAPPPAERQAVAVPNPTVRPNIPTQASVARQATLPNAIRLNRLNLIGVYGSASNRRALLRLPTGRYVKVKVGDSVDGGRIASIASSRLDYVKGGRTVTLAMPN